MRTPDDTREDFDDLPILEELRGSLAEAFMREEAAARPAPARARRRRWGRRSRRLLVAALALVVVVPSAIATRPIWAPTPERFDPGFQGDTPAGIIVAEGAGGQTRWQLSVVMRKGDRCATLAAGRVSNVFCLPPDIDLVAQALQTGGDRFVGGLTSSAITEVRVVPRPGAPAVVVPTRAPDPERLRRGGIPATFRFFVGSVAVDERSAVVSGHDAAGKRVARFRLFGG